MVLWWSPWLTQNFVRERIAQNIHLGYDETLMGEIAKNRERYIEVGSFPFFGRGASTGNVKWFVSFWGDVWVTANVDF